MTNSVIICISPLTAIMQEQSQRFSKGGITSGLLANHRLYDRKF